MARDDYQPPQKPGFLKSLLLIPLSLLGWLTLAFVFSLLTEIVGQWLFWGDQGSAHSARILQTELGYLNRDFMDFALFTLRPVDLVMGMTQSIYHLTMQLTGLDALANALAQSGSSHSTLVEMAKGVQNAMLIFGVRLSLVILSIPLFLLVAVWAALEGMVRRDLRRFGGGHESGWVFHHAKFFLKPIAILPAALYLSLPISLHPAAVFLPFAFLLGLSVMVMATTFKKYV